ncbi:MAG: hypothetical protein ACLP3B_05200 [Syntrophobacteraceae bacterium]
MKKILVIFAILLFAAPALAQFSPTVQPQGQLQYQQPTPQYQPAPQMNSTLQPNNLDNWHKANYPAQHPETWQPTQQEKINDQWRHSAAPGVSGVAVLPPPGIMWPDRRPQE